MRKYIILISLASILQLGYTDKDRENLCPEITGCICYKPTHSWIIFHEVLHCEDVTDPPIHLLTRKSNIDRVTLRRCTFSNVSMMRELRETVVRRLSLIHNRFPNETGLVFDWNWLPDTANNVSFTKNTLQRFKSGTTENNCNLTRFSKEFKLYIDEEKLTRIPTCIPKTTMTINLLNLPENVSQDNIQWPQKLRILKMSEGSLKNFSSDLFKHIPDSLLTLYITKQEFTNGIWPNGLPSKSLTKLIVTHSNLSQIPKDAFKSFRESNKLISLWLSYNKLKDVPNHLPESLENLRINNNEIRYITEEHWSTMKNLQYLDLSSNLLTVVPLKLPSTVTKIELYSNLIAISPPEAFAHLKNLKYLNLLNNTLTAMPTGILPGLESYLIGRNRISLVTGPEGYDFCINCHAIQLYGNPWYCNLEMLKMLNWFVSHNVTIYDPGHETTEVEHITRCRSIVIPGVGESWLTVAIEFMEYYNKPPNNKCVYEIETLKCEDAALLQVPKKIPPSLEQLFIGNNPEIKTIPDYKFYNQTELWRLELNNNSLTRVPIGLPTTLRELSLKYNLLGNWTEKDLAAFANLTSLKNLYLEDNKIKVLYGWQFEHLKQLKWIGLVGNQLHCDCSLESFTNWYSMTIPHRPSLIARPYATCATPPDRYSLDIRRQSAYFSYGLQCAPYGCYPIENKKLLNCTKEAKISESNIYNATLYPVEPVHVPTNSFWEELYLNGQNLRSHQIDYRNLTRLRYIDLSDNRNEEIPLTGLPSSLKTVILYNNDITILPEHKIIHQYLPNLEKLDLRNNKIKIIDTGMRVSNLELITHIYLSGNPFICNCSLRPLVEWIHVNQENKAIMDRLELQSLTCTLDDESPQIYKMVDIDLHDYCRGFQFGAIIGSVVAIVLIIIIIIIVVCVHKQKKRRARVSKEILLGFQGLLEKEKEEEGDPETGVGVNKEYKFDAFVSYDPNGIDAEFVISLLEELEDKRDYKLCLNERDFIPGAGITDNIVECIGASKHVMLVLSKSFVTSPWCQYEVQVALAELHQRRKSRLLIPILLEDISEDEDLAMSVKTLMSLAPGIEVPPHMPDEGDEWNNFWKNLVNVMPQNKDSIV